MHRGGRLRGTAGPAHVALVAWVLGLAVASAHAQAEPRVRVLVAERKAAVRLGSAALGGQGERRVAPEGGALQMDGKAIGPRLELGPPGPHRVDGRSYRGAIEVLYDAGRVLVINEVPLESYVAGMVLGEVYQGWGEAALQAQAVAGRTYALHRRDRARGDPYHLEAGTSGQVYLGVRGESRTAWSAARRTHGEVLVWKGAPILAAFHSSSGGRTASAAEVWGRPLPYLRSVVVEGEDASPDTYWRAPLSNGKLSNAVARLARPLGPIEELRVVERSPSGRVRRLEARGREGKAIVEGRALRRALGLSFVRSTLFEVRRDGADFVLVGSGRGHGVGLSQWGARAMAERGMGYREILAHFYPGAQLTRLGAGPRLATQGPESLAGAEEGE